MRSWRVPFWISGEITITTDGEVGTLGVRESVPKIVKIPAVPLLPLVFPWLALAGCVLAVKHNRHARAWLGMLPFMAIWGVLNGLGNASLMEFNSEVATGMYLSLAFGLSAVWFLAPVMEGRPRAFKITLQTGIILVATLANLSISLAERVIRPSWFFYEVGAMVAVAYLVAGHLAARSCRRNPQWKQLSGMMLTLQLGICYGLLTGLGLVSDRSGQNMSHAVFSLALTSVVLLVPFLLLGCFSASCRQRWENLFGLAPEPARSETSQT